MVGCVVDGFCVVLQRCAKGSGRGDKGIKK